MKMRRMLTTYRRADGEPIVDECTWVTDLEYLTEDCCCEPYEVVEEVWVLEKSRTFVVGPSRCWCDICDEDVELPAPVLDGYLVLCGPCADAHPWTLLFDPVPA